jgi:L-gulonate 5-dehydrogenase
MRAAITTGPGQISVEAVIDPDPGSGDALVDVGAVGLCGTDLHMFLGERHDTGFPLRQGHEIGGTVAALPTGYAGPLDVGRTVTVDPALPCGRCRPACAGVGLRAPTSAPSGWRCRAAWPNRSPCPSGNCTTQAS